MDFFERQEIARRNTRWLIVYFILAVLGTVIAIHFAVGLAFSYEQSDASRGLDLSPLWDPQFFLAIFLGTIAVVAIGSTYKIAQLAGGGSTVAEMLGGRPVAANTTDPGERKLLNVVEEMAIASGTPMPLVYVLPNEGTINAFAAGHSTGDMAVAVTRGALQSLNRDELQGVIGHEFSHILNGDMKLNLRLMGVVFGILCIAMIGRVLMRVRSSGKKGNPLPLLGLLLFIIGYIGVFFGKLIKSAVSRQREFLADAASVQFTRNPSGLANALKKVGSRGSTVSDPNAEEASHFFFANGLGDLGFDWMATHPPLEERIRELDPQWDGKFLSATRTELEVMDDLDKEKKKAKPPLPPDLTKALGLGVLASATGAGAVAVPVAMAATGASVTDAVGAPTARHLDYAADILANLPESLTTATREPLSATALIYGLLLSPEETVRTRQMESLTSDPAVYAELQKLQAGLSALEIRGRLPLVTLAMTALRHLSAAQYDAFTSRLQTLIAADGQIDLFEYMLQKMIQHRLDPHFHPVTKRVAHYYAVKPVLPDCRVLLSALANFGHSDPAQAQRAFLRGTQELPFAATDDVRLLEPGACGIGPIDDALNHLNQTTPQIKKLVIGACAETAATDGEIHPNEAELLRAIADTLDCPLPPFLTV